jgi:hypothetical protein
LAPLQGCLQNPFSCKLLLSCGRFVCLLLKNQKTVFPVLKISRVFFFTTGYLSNSSLQSHYTWIYAPGSLLGIIYIV